jgi:hypothetical protein
MASVIQPSFAGGEIAPAAYGRVDLARYANSLKTCRNMIVRATGGVFNRPGLPRSSANAGSTPRRGSSRSFST